jgi:hypothetical protein
MDNPQKSGAGHLSHAAPGLAGKAQSPQLMPIRSVC